MLNKNIETRVLKLWEELVEKEKITSLKIIIEMPLKTGIDVVCKINKDDKEEDYQLSKLREFFLYAKEEKENATEKWNRLTLSINMNNVIKETKIYDSALQKDAENLIQD